MYMLYGTMLMDIYTHLCTHMHTNVYTGFLNHPYMGKHWHPMCAYTVINFSQFVVAALRGFQFPVVGYQLAIMSA